MPRPSGNEDVPGIEKRNRERDQGFHRRTPDRSPRAQILSLPGLRLAGKERIRQSHCRRDRGDAAPTGSALRSRLRGYYWRCKNEYEKAIADFNEAIRLDPRNDQAYSQRSRVWYERKEYDKAMADCDEAVRIDPKDASLYDDRGDVWERKKQYDKAIPPTIPRPSGLIRNPLGPISVALPCGRPRRTWTRPSKTTIPRVRLEPSSGSSLADRALARLQKKDLKKAASDLEAAVNVDPKNAYAIYARSVFLFVTRGHNVTDGFKLALKLAGWRDDVSCCAALMGYFAAQNEGNREQAQALLDEAAGNATSAWPYPIIKHLRGEIDEPKLMTAVPKATG